MAPTRSHCRCILALSILALVACGGSASTLAGDPMYEQTKAWLLSSPQVQRDFGPQLMATDGAGRYLIETDRRLARFRIHLSGNGKDGEIHAQNWAKDDGLWHNHFIEYEVNGASVGIIGDDESERQAWYDAFPEMTTEAHPFPAEAARP